MPLALLVRVPLVGVAQPVQVVVAVAGLRLPLGSVSLAATLMVTGVAAGVVAVSSPATGGALVATGVTLMVTLAVSQALSVSQIW